MRITSGATDLKVPFVATLAGRAVTGLSSFTVYRSRNGGTATVMTTPTVSESSSSNMPGLYWLTVDEDTTIDSGHDNEMMVLHITASGMDAQRVEVELYRPKITVGETLTVDAGVAQKQLSVTS